MRAGEPSGPIQLIPPGLLGLLQIKSPAGQNPNVLNADVQPSLEMEGYWLRANRQVWALNSGITVVASAVNAFQGFSPNAIQVPQNQWWYIHSYTLGVQCQVGGSVTGLSLAMLFNSVGTLRFRGIESHNQGVLDNLVAADGRVISTATNFWMPPGSSLGTHIGTISVADLVLNVDSMDYTILPI